MIFLEERCTTRIMPLKAAIKSFLTTLGQWNKFKTNYTPSRSRATLVCLWSHSSVNLMIVLPHFPCMVWFNYIFDTPASYLRYCVTSSFTCHLLNPFISNQTESICTNPVNCSESVAGVVLWPLTFKKQG